MTYHEIEADHPELKEIPTFSSAWYRRWRELHLLRYPDVDRSTRDNLDMFVSFAEAQERKDHA